MPALPAQERPPPDLRAVVLGVSAWAGGLVVLGLPGWTWLVLVVLASALMVSRRRRGRAVLTLAACLVAATAVGGVTALRVEANRQSPVALLAEQGAAVTLTARVASDPVLRTGRFGSFTLTRVTVLDVTGRGRRQETRVPLLVIGDASWKQVELGSRVRASGRLAPADGADLAGVLSTGRPPAVLVRPGEVFDGAARVRAGIRASVAGASPDARALVPALVVGDDRSMSDRVVEDFRTCGLTHLAAVSGTNLTLVVGFLLVVSRWVGVRARGLVVVGALGVAGFVLLARPEPSVLRAAAMGSVALVGLGSRGRDHGIRALGVAVLVLLLLDPWLAVSVGFALSTLATAGILFLGPAVPRRPDDLAAPVGGRGSRGPVRGAARLHAGRGRAVRTGQPGRRRGEPGGGGGRRSRDRPRSRGRAADAGGPSRGPGLRAVGRSLRRLGDPGGDAARAAAHGGGRLGARPGPGRSFSACSASPSGSPPPGCCGGPGGRSR